MIRDAQGHDLTGATAEAARSIDAGVRAYAQVVEHLMPARFSLARMGGSPSREATFTAT